MVAWGSSLERDTENPLASSIGEEGDMEGVSLGLAVFLVLGLARVRGLGTGGAIFRPEGDPRFLGDFLVMGVSNLEGF